MSGGVSIDPTVLRAAGTALAQVGDQLDGALKQLESQIQSLGQPWGNDTIGQLIGTAFHEVVSYAFDTLRKALGDLRKSGTDLKGMADQYEALEKQITDVFANLRQILESR